MHDRRQTPSAGMVRYYALSTRLRRVLAFLGWAGRTIKGAVVGNA